MRIDNPHYRFPDGRTGPAYHLIDQTMAEAQSMISYDESIMNMYNAFLLEIIGLVPSIDSVSLQLEAGFPHSPSPYGSNLEATGWCTVSSGTTRTTWEQKNTTPVTLTTAVANTRLGSMESENTHWNIEIPSVGWKIGSNSANPQFVWHGFGKNDAGDACQWTGMARVVGSSRLKEFRLSLSSSATFSQGLFRLYGIRQ